MWAGINTQKSKKSLLQIWAEKRLLTELIKIMLTRIKQAVATYGNIKNVCLKFTAKIAPICGGKKLQSLASFIRIDQTFSYVNISTYSLYAAELFVFIS